MSEISPEQVRSQVQTFWRLFSAKSKREFTQLYRPDATVFAANSPRSESARPMLVRRTRELFGPTSTVGAKLGAITVQILRPDLAIASYPFHYSVTRTLPNGRRYRLEVPFGRVTQVFLLDEGGSLRIVHEHMSSAEAVSSQELPETESADSESR